MAFIANVINELSPDIQYYYYYYWFSCSLHQIAKLLFTGESIISNSMDCIAFWTPQCSCVLCRLQKMLFSFYECIFISYWTSLYKYQEIKTFEIQDITVHEITRIFRYSDRDSDRDRDRDLSLIHI